MYKKPKLANGNSTSSELNWVQDRQDFKHKLLAYYQLTKPTVTMLVVVTVIPALFLVNQHLPSLRLLFSTLLGTGLCSASAAVFNQMIERGIDASMQRTQKRAIPSGIVSRNEAAFYALILLGLGFTLLYTQATPLSAYLALAGHLFYAVVYTMFLKRLTVQNIVIGGAAGAVGPLIGWAAVNGDLSWPAWTLFAIILLWTPPHFWALALKYKEDYAKAKIPMYPVVMGDEKTRRLMFIYTCTLVVPILCLFTQKVGGLVYFIPSVLLTLKFIWDAFKIYTSHSNEKVLPFFVYSCFYTLAVFLFLTLDAILQRI